jgi:hypothetical protein
MMHFLTFCVDWSNLAGGESSLTVPLMRSHLLLRITNDRGYLGVFHAKDSLVPVRVVYNFPIVHLLS